MADGCDTAAALLVFPPLGEDVIQESRFGGGALWRICASQGGFVCVCPPFPHFSLSPKEPLRRRHRWVVLLSSIAKNDLLRPTLQLL